ncbi:MAG: ATP-binding protein [Labilithrix sp.]
MAFVEWIHQLRLRVATKFASALMAVALLTLAVVISILSLHERRAVAREVAFDLQVEADALAPILAETWTQGGEAHARAVMRALEAAHPEVTIHLDAGAPTAAAPNERYVARAPIDLHAEGAPKWLVLERSASPPSSMLAPAVETFALASLPLAIVAAVLSYALGEWLVGAPLERVTALMRGIGSGDLKLRLPVRGSAEIAALKREVNAMADKLEAARETARREEARRLEAVERLRHVDRLKTVGTLAAGVAHEVGTPLNVILIEAQNIGKAATDPERVARGAVVIREQAARMTKIVRQLLDFARRRKPAREPHGATALATSAAALLESLARTRGCSVEVVTEGPPKVVDVDGAAMQQVLTNLLMNAFDAMAPSGGAVEVRVSNVARPAPAEETSREWVRIAVSDSGSGMDEETRVRVFEPFFTTKQVGAGTGLGLAVALGIIEDHGGFIEVESSPGSGTTFLVYLPSSA